MDILRHPDGGLDSGTSITWARYRFPAVLTLQVLVARFLLVRTIYRVVRQLIGGARAALFSIQYIPSQVSDGPGAVDSAKPTPTASTAFLVHVSDWP